ncbi:PEP-CTERM sorting domain-containing protein [Duganella callida]|uniref:PEP-CTERM sorting domain-containing protein n=1 Tax=Duganella callida TaxID=2561932 RepID=A0A4Y9SIC9_9BURK|nr:PEP-CTERM sorting domain-containing protein [Duganella callida]TFW25298.1 PEP-CTERM sorting domain-containing protein [Duganella callida]
MKRFVMHTLAAACLAAAVGPVFANASSSATFGNLVITLTDLNPNDGIAPSMSFTAYGHAYVLGETLAWGDLKDDTLYAYTAKQQQGVLSGETHTDWSSATSSVTTANTVAGFTALSAQGTANSGLDANGAYRSYATGADPFENGFVLSANTKVTFSTNVSMQTQTTMGYNLDADQMEYANAHALLYVAGSVNGVDRSDTQERDMWSTFDVRDDGSTMGMHDSWSGQFSVSFANDSAMDASGTMKGFVSTEGYSAVWDGVTPVPEPETYAMLLGGLGLIGAIGRRRKARAER